MTAKQLHKKILSKIRGGYSVRVCINRGRKHGLKDTFEEIQHYTGMSLEQASEFMTKRKN